jgi:ATP-dependent Clp protease protease subunit
MTSKRLAKTFNGEPAQAAPAPANDSGINPVPLWPLERYYRDPNDRTVYVNEINAASALDIVAQLRYFEKLDPEKPIRMVIHSGGGSISAGQGIIGVMKTMHAPVHTAAFGDCESMASLLLAAGTKGHREIYPGTRFMIHQPHLSDNFGRESQGNNTAWDMANTRRRSEHLYLHFIGLPATKKNLNLISDALETDTVMNAHQVKALGLADRIIDVPPENSYANADAGRRIDLQERRAYMKVMEDVDRIEADSIDMKSHNHAQLGQRAIKALIQEHERQTTKPVPEAAPRLRRG